MRTLLIAGNWKMHPIPDGALEKDSPFRLTEGVEVAVFPTFVDLQACIDANLPTGAQYGHPEDHGAHTGDVSMAMIKQIGCTHVLCGHSDRRAEHRESDEEVGEQARAALEHGLSPIICVGETADERKAGRAEEVVKRQLDTLPTDQGITIAYEPVWAISRGDPNAPAATPDDAAQMHRLIRDLLPEAQRASTRILYGGSMKPENAEALLSLEDVDGGLIGGASLSTGSFGEIVNIAKNLHS